MGILHKESKSDCPSSDYGITDQLIMEKGLKVRKR